MFGTRLLLEVPCSVPVERRYLTTSPSLSEEGIVCVVIPPLINVTIAKPDVAGDEFFENGDNLTVV